MMKNIALIIIFAVMLSVSLSYIPAYAMDAGYVGLNAGTYKAPDPMAEADQIIASGTKWVRMGAEWGAVETSKGVYNQTYLTKFDAVVDKYVQNGVNILFPLSYTPLWATSNPNSDKPRFCKPANWEDWESYVTFVTNRYKGKIKAWEVWNEPDADGFWRGTQAEYYTMLERTYPIIKEMDANNTVLVGGMSFHNGVFGIGSWFDGVLEMGAAQYFDVINYHTYVDTMRMYEKYQGVMDLVAKYQAQLGSKPIWITETGYTTYGDTAKEIEKADMVNQIYLLHKRFKNIEKIFWYCYRNPTYNNAQEDNFGLMTAEGAILPAYYHYQSTGGAASDFSAQQRFPDIASNILTLHYIKGGDGNSLVYQGGNITIPNGTCMYMGLNDQWLYDANGGVDTTAYIDVTYLDNFTSSWCVEYDGQRANYTLSDIQTGSNTGTWKTVTLTINDLKFANRQNLDSDFRINAMNTDLTVGKVVVRKEANKGTCVLGTTDRSTLLQHVIDNDSNNMGYNPVATVGGVVCRSITANNKYFNFICSKGLMKDGDTDAAIGVTYWDSGTDKIAIQYFPVGETTNKTVYITKTDTKTWKYAEVTVNDANFLNQKSYKADFSIGNAGDGSSEYISKVSVVNRSVTQIPDCVDDTFDFPDGYVPADGDGWTVGSGISVVGKALKIQSNDTAVHTLARSFPAISGDKVTVQFTVKMPRIPDTSLNDFINITDDTTNNTIANIKITVPKTNSKNLTFTGGNGEAYTMTNPLQGGETYFVKFVISYGPNTSTPGSFTCTIENLDQPGLGAEEFTLPIKGNGTIYPARAAKFISNVKTGASSPCIVIFDDLRIYDANQIEFPAPASPPGRINAAHGKPVTVSSNSSTANRIVDGTVDDNSRWLAATNDGLNGWICVDLGVPTKIDSAQIYSGALSIYGATDYKLQYDASVNPTGAPGDNWVDIPGAAVISTDTYVNTPNNVLLTFDSAVTARYIRLYSTVKNAPLRIRELKLYLSQTSPLTLYHTSLQKGGDHVTGTTSIVNYSGTAKNAMTVMALYKGNQLIQTELINSPVAASTGLQSYNTQSMTLSGSEYKIKLFLWDSLIGTQPLTTAQQLEAY